MTDLQAAIAWANERADYMTLSSGAPMGEAKHLLALIAAAELEAEAAAQGSAAATGDEQINESRGGSSSATEGDAQASGQVGVTSDRLTPTGAHEGLIAEIDAAMDDTWPNEMRRVLARCRAALQAESPVAIPREPTEAMLRAGQLLHGGLAENIWRAMHDAALDETTK